MRGLGELTVVSGLPDAVVTAFGLLTTLGDPWVVLGVLALMYAAADRLPVDRRRVGFVLAAGFVALGATLALKSAFALPRPPGALADGYGFPSGHALGATVVWGTAAVVLDVGRRRDRLAVASVVVPVVATSRVVIRVHYLVDVVAGIAVGLVLVGTVLAVGAGRDRADLNSHAAVDRVFGLASAVALVALVVDPTPDILVAVGATVGSWVGWRVAEPTVATPQSLLPLRGTTVALVGLPVVLGGLLAATAASEAAAIPGPVAVGLAGVCAALLLALPRVAARTVDWT